MDTNKSFMYFKIDDIDVSGLDLSEFYPIIEVDDEGKEECGAAAGFYIKTLPANLKFILLPSDTELKKKPVAKNINLTDEPINIYLGELNVKRIKAVDDIALRFSVTKGTVKEIFCEGADWALEIIYPEAGNIRKFKKGQK